MDILFEIFQLKEPDWTDDFHIALLSVGMALSTRFLTRFFEVNFKMKPCSTISPVLLLITSMCWSKFQKQDSLT